MPVPGVEHDEVRDDQKPDRPPIDICHDGRYYIISGTAALYEGRDAEVANLDPDKQVALKTHEGTCMGIDHDLYQRRISVAAKSVESRTVALEAKCKALLK